MVEQNDKMEYNLLQAIHGRDDGEEESAIPHIITYPGWRINETSFCDLRWDGSNLLRIL